MSRYASILLISMLSVHAHSSPEEDLLREAFGQGPVIPNEISRRCEDFFNRNEDAFGDELQSSLAQKDFAVSAAAEASGELSPLHWLDLYGNWLEGNLHLDSGKSSSYPAELVSDLQLEAAIMLLELVDQTEGEHGYDSLEAKYVREEASQKLAENLMHVFIASSESASDQLQSFHEVLEFLGEAPERSSYEILLDEYIAMAPLPEEEPEVESFVHEEAMDPYLAGLESLVISAGYRLDLHKHLWGKADVNQRIAKKWNQVRFRYYSDEDEFSQFIKAHSFVGQFATFYHEWQRAVFNDFHYPLLEMDFDDPEVASVMEDRIDKNLAIHMGSRPKGGFVNDNYSKSILIMAHFIGQSALEEQLKGFEGWSANFLDYYEETSPAWGTDNFNSHVSAAYTPWVTIVSLWEAIIVWNAQNADSAFAVSTEELLDVASFQPRFIFQVMIKQARHKESYDFAKRYLDEFPLSTF